MNYRKPRFEFTRSDRSGSFFLALIVVCVQGLGPHIFPSNWAPKREILQPKAHGSPVENIVYNANYLSDFDAYQLGMSLKALRRYRYLRGQGYYFKNLEILVSDLHVNDSMKNHWEGRLQFVGEARMRKRRQGRSFTKKDLNRVTAQDLEGTYGIGPVLSKRIVAYRALLGGYVHIDQLAEVYGLTAVIISRLKERYRVVADFTPIRMQVDAENQLELEKHPYLSSDQVKRLILHRELKGAPLEKEDLRVLLDVSDKKFNKIKLYLYF
ncbi:ComEA family DNA-binding protein [Aureicoccus marinus]|uniref:Competence protein ComEA n=1 Tax=Aureicoccus marinus TaxID=754435 RepID=A0A2S7T6M6_9FLAO|nr:helix-hairpin-helix domain-containing protein [Aureicoccus marinus]PQJ15572.1 hypothetical protein BST99_07360 [Aureicoccus marinus]